MWFKAYDSDVDTLLHYTDHKLHYQLELLLVNFTAQKTRPVWTTVHLDI